MTGGSARAEGVYEWMECGVARGGPELDMEMS